MKKIFTKLMLLAVAAAALVSCENNWNEEQTPIVKLTQTVTLSAEKPTEVRTQLIEGVPYWSKGDQIGVYVVDGDSYKNYAFKNDNEEASLTTSFTGETAVANTLYVYYPYTNFNDPVTEKGVKVEIRANQEPTAASFDGRTDLMIAKPVQLDTEGKQLNNLEFARVAAIVKIVLKDKTGNLAGQHVSSLTMTAENNLVGRVYLDVVNQEINSKEGLYYGGAPSVTATYTEATQYEVDGTNATYVVVYPQTLATGSKLSFEAATEGYAISKEITLPSDIELLAGKVTTLNVSLAAENVVKEETGLALPFEDDYSWVGNTSTNAFASITAKFPTRDDAAMYTAVSTVYPEDNTALKFSSGNAVGSLTTAALDLSQPFSVVVNAKYHNTDTSSLVITVGEVTKTIALTADYADYIVEFDAATKKETITLSGTAKSKRFYLNDFKVVAGHDYVLPPVLTVSKSEISVSHEAATETFTYSVANPVDGVSATVTDDVDWITTSVSGTTVTVTVAANEVEEAREGVVTVTYGDLTKTVTVKQNAKPAAGEQTAQYVKVTSTADITDGQYLIVYETAKIAMNGNLSVSAIDADNNYQKVDITNSTIPSNATTDAMAFTYNASNKSFKSAQGYWIGRTGSSNGMDESASTEHKHTTVSISNGNATITSSGGPNLQLYQSGSTYRFRYFKTTQKAVQLYKLVGESGGEGGSTPEPEPATPVLSVNPTNLSFDAAAGSKTIACTIENEVSGQNVTATETVDWLSTSVSGKNVTVTATANTGAERTATVTIAYAGAESKTVTVSQAAGNTGGGDEPEQGGDPVTVTMTTFSAVSGSLDSVISYTAAKNDGTAAPTINSNAIRLYQPSSGKTNGGSITITAKEGYTITSITIGSNQATTTAYSINGGATSSNSSIAANGKLTVTQDAQSITFYCRGTSSSQRLNVNYLSVTYK